MNLFWNKLPKNQPIHNNILCIIIIGHPRPGVHMITSHESKLGEISSNHR